MESAVFFCSDNLLKIQFVTEMNRITALHERVKIYNAIDMQEMQGVKERIEPWKKTTTVSEKDFL